MNRDRISVIVAGGGWVTNNRHLPALFNSRRYRVLGVVSDDEYRARETARRFNLPHFSTELTFEDWQSEAEAVVIGAIPQAHAELASRALEAGRHVLCEKPLAVNPSDADHLCALASRKQRVLAVVHNFQFSRAARKLSRKLRSGVMGRIRAVYGLQLCNEERNIPDWCDRLPLGLFYDEAPHFYYLLRWLGGDPLELLQASVWPAHSQRNTPCAVSAEYCSPERIPLYLHINFESSITEWHVLVVTDKATIDLDIWRDIFVQLPNDGAHGPWEILRTSLYGGAYHFTGVVSGALRYAAGRHLYGNDEVVRRFHSAVRGDSPQLAGISADDGRRVVHLMHELIQRATYYR